MATGVVLLAAVMCMQCRTAPTAVDASQVAGPAEETRLVPDGTSLLDDDALLARSNPLAFLRKCRRLYRERVRDYECVFTKQELIGRRMTPEQETRIKFRTEPFSVNMKWVRNADQAEHAIYVAGKWRDRRGQEQAWVRPAGAILKLLIPRIRQPIHGTRSKTASRRTIDQFGFERTLDLIIEYSSAAQRQGDLVLRFAGEGSFGGRPTLVFERFLPYTGQERPYPDRMLRFHIDKEWLLPTASFSYADDQGRELLGKYLLTDCRFNVGLNDNDFDPKRLGA